MRDSNPSRPDFLIYLEPHVRYSLSEKEKEYFMAILDSSFEVVALALNDALVQRSIEN
jgi:hypothetical protein